MTPTPVTRSGRQDGGTAFVLSGGASLGSIQVGMAAALAEAGITPDMIFATSVGAVNGAWLAADKPIEGLADVWRDLRRKQLFPLRPLIGLSGFVGRRPNFMPNNGVRRLLRRHLAFSHLEGAKIPFTVIAADASTGEEVALSKGPAIPAILASAALPGVFPPVEVDGRLLIDGGVVNNTPITNAIEAGASEVYVLSTGYSCGVSAPPSSAIAMAMHSIALLVQRRLVNETAAREYPVPVYMVPPPCPINMSPIDFSQSADLIRRAEIGTRQWLESGCPNALPLTADHFTLDEIDTDEVDSEVEADETDTGILAGSLEAELADLVAAGA